MTLLTIPAPDDFHCHLRDNHFLTRTVTDISASFRRAIVMPNLNPAVTTVAAAHAYRERILAALPAGRVFEPLMTLYLTPHTDPDEIVRGKHSGVITACKLYPARATTHAEAGIHQLTDSYAVFDAMQRVDMPLLIHAESTDPEVDLLHTETHFIEEQVVPLLRQFPRLRVVLEHISTRHSVDFVLHAAHPIAATITPHHLLFTLNDLLGQGLRPHYYCKPVVKQRADREALLAAALSGSPKFFLGTDSAPHTKHQKECAQGCAGVYNAPVALALYAEIFERHHALTKLADFASRFGAEFYRLPLNTNTVTLERRPWQVPDQLAFGDEVVIPLCAGQTLSWQLHP